MYLVLISHCMTEILAKECKSGKLTLLVLGTLTAFGRDETFCPCVGFGVRLARWRSMDVLEATTRSASCNATYQLKLATMFLNDRL